MTDSKASATVGFQSTADIKFVAAWFSSLALYFSRNCQNKVIYEWYVCGLDQDYKNIYPSVLATWAAIEYGLKNNLETFDFMGVGVPDKDYGVREFKSKFGGELVNFGRFGRINNHFIYTITEIGFNVLALLRKI